MKGTQFSRSLILYYQPIRYRHYYIYNNLIYENTIHMQPCSNTFCFLLNK